MRFFNVDKLTLNIDLINNKEYKTKYGFSTNIAANTFVPGLSKQTILLISKKKHEPNFLKTWRLEAYQYWVTLVEPIWSSLCYKNINYYNIIYYSAPKTIENKKKFKNTKKIINTYKKLNIQLQETETYKVAIDAIFDSVSVITTFQKQLFHLGIVFSSFTEAVQNYPTLIKKYLGSVVTITDNYFATLNSAVYSDGSFCYIPKNIICPIELSTYFRINTILVGQFERTLIIADEYSYVGYLEGCTAPIRNENQLHAAVVEIITLKKAIVKYSTIQNWYSGNKMDVGGIFNFVTKRGLCLGKLSIESIQ